MKLYIDDIRQPYDDSWELVTTVDSAISAISMMRNHIQHISLDYDISHQVEVSGLSRPYPCNESFRSVAFYIKEIYRGKYKPRIILHTANPDGANKMKDILKRFDVVIKLSKPANRLENGHA